MSQLKMAQTRPLRNGLLSIVMLMLITRFQVITPVTCEHTEAAGLIGVRSTDLGKRLNILVVTFHVTGHIMPLISLGEELRSRGHNVTIAANTIEGDLNPEKVVRESGLEFYGAGNLHKSKPELEKLLEELAKNPVNLLAAFQMFAMVEVQLYQKLDPLLEAGKEFEKTDILIADGMTQTGVWLARKHSLPVVINDPHSFAAKLPPSISYPTFPSGFNHRMPFLKRVGNSLFVAVGYGLNAYKDSQVRKLVNERGIVEPEGYRFSSASVNDRYVAEAVLVNTIPGLDFPREAGPNQFFVGPQVSSTIQPVPQDVATWLQARESAGDPTVLVTFGSSAYLNDAQGRTFLRGLIDSRVHAIWPCRLGNRGFLQGVDVPERIRIEEWVPQQAILNHSAVSGYVGHCGTGGTHQTLAFGKPVVCTAFMADHFETAARITAAGAGRSIDLQVLSRGDAATVTEAIKSIASRDSPYRTGAERVAALMRAYGGKRSAANVVEYIAAFGYDHLKIVSFEWNWAARNGVDVLAFWSAVLYVFWLLGSFGVRRLVAAIAPAGKQKAA